MADEDETDDEEDMSNNEDVSATPGPGADTASEIERFVPKELRELYEVHSYRHAASILANSHADEYAEIIKALRTFKFTTDDIRKPGKNESDITKRVIPLLRDNNWFETRIKADLAVSKVTMQKSGKKKTVKTTTTVDIPNFVDGHKVDFVKNRVAFDMEWNSKDQTFDRDLYAFRAFYDCSLISAGVLLTRSASLNEVFTSLGKEVSAKYGASTTWMGKLLFRLNAGRNGGCPVLVFGITPKLVTDWKRK